jgi:mRNA-degrading endonuclease YafQ of YafQ-DinJ toxin-antitoxin module
MPFCATSSAKNAGTIAAYLEAVLTVAVSLLAEDTPLPERNRDHALGGTGATIESAPLSPICC